MSGPEALVGPVDAPEISAMTLNVRRTVAGSIDWRRRSPRLRELLRRERPTLLGVQEALPAQAAAIRAALGDEYRRVGHGRDARGRGEGCPVFFDGSRLELQEWAQVALSPRPSVPGSRGWGALFPRILVRARLRDRVTGVVFTALNTHLDVLSARARRLSAPLIAAAAGSGPVVVTADFNEGPDAPARRALERAGLADTWDTAPARLTPERSTFAPQRPGGPARRIDAVLARGWRVRAVGIDDRPIDGGWVSDHAPVIAVLGPKEPGT